MERYYSLSAVPLIQNPRGFLKVEWNLFKLSPEEETFERGRAHNTHWRYIKLVAQRERVLLSHVFVKHIGSPDDGMEGKWFVFTLFSDVFPFTALRTGVSTRAGHYFLSP